MEDGENVRVHKKYVKQFQEHVEDVAARLRGATDSHASSPPSYIPPCGYWSEEDKGRFFHALSVHSRLRPDLIAEDIPGKTIADVCVYLDALTVEATKTPRKLSRSAFPRALEVSDGWIEFEEAQARAMAASESTWEALQRKRQRQAELRSEKRALQTKRGDNFGQGQHSVDINAAFGEARGKREAEWEKEDYVGELSAAHLRAIDNILRETEEAIAGAAPEDSRAPDGEHGHVDPSEMQNDSANVPDPASLTGDPMTRADIAIGRGSAEENSVQAEDVVGGIPAPSLSIPADTEEPLAELGNLSPRSRRRHQKRMYMRRKRAMEAGKEASMALTRLRPGRKTNKRLLRELSRARKRQNSRDSMLSDEEVNLDDATFTIPGQEDTKDETIDAFEGKEEIEISLGTNREEESRRSHSPTAEDLDVELGKYHPNIGGLTLPYKIKEDLAALGFDGQVLEKEGLGLFHLSRFAELMSMQASLQESEPGTVSRISGNLIKLLHAEVVYFVTNLVHRSIALHEQEWISKAHTKVWRLQMGRVRVGTVHQALEMMGATKDKKDYFAPLVDHLSRLYEDPEFDEANPAHQYSSQSDHDTTRTSDEDHESEVTITNNASNTVDDGDSRGASPRKSEPPVPLYREIFAAFLWHSSLNHPCPIPGRLDASSSGLNVDVLGVSSESRLVDELAEEEELDAADVVDARQAEQDLWAEFGHRKKVGGGTPEPERLLLQRTQEPDRMGDGAPPVEAPIPRKRRRGARYESSQRFKSSVYVEDSE